MKGDASLLGVIAWRINPLIAFRLMDLGYGLTRISFRKYFIGIVVISFFRIFWLQFILAGIGTSLLSDISAMLDYFLANPQIIRYSAIYFVSVMVLTIMAVVQKFLIARKAQ